MGEQQIKIDTNMIMTNYIIMCSTLCQGISNILVKEFVCVGGGGWCRLC